VVATVSSSGIRTGENAGRHPSIASVYRALTDIEDRTATATHA
jgi:hypothetical protein